MILFFFLNRVLGQDRDRWMAPCMAWPGVASKLASIVALLVSQIVIKLCAKRKMRFVCLMSYGV